MFLPEKSNTAKLMDNVDSNINKLVSYGFLKSMDNGQDFEVRRILKARIDIVSLVEIKEKMVAYAESIL